MKLLSPTRKGGFFRPNCFLGPKTVVSKDHIAYDISMKKLFTFILCCVALPAVALQEAALERALTTPTEDPVVLLYSSDRALNSQRAIRLGYKNFQSRIHTSDVTDTDTQIAILITTGFQPLFEKIDQLETLPKKERAERIAQYNQEFNNLALQLAQLLFKNQRRYVAPAFLDDGAALEETAKIIQEAIEKGTF